MADTFKFHGDHVGSLLRPGALVEARRRLEAGMIEHEELRVIEDDAIRQAFRLQKDAGLQVFTDGEFRREDFRSAIVDAVDGFDEEVAEMDWHGPDGVHKVPTKRYFVSERLSQNRRLTEGDVAFMRTLTTGGHLKFTLISPGFLAENAWKDGVTDRVYESREELGADIAEIIRKEAQALFDEGVIYVQLDNPSYTGLLNRAGNGDRIAIFDRMLAADTAAVEGLQRMEGGAVGLHICHGNQGSMWLSEGDYGPIAERLFNELPVDRFLLEFDDERSGGYEPLKYVPDGKVVVLGLISSKTPKLENVEELVKEIDAATEYVNIDDLAVSPQCGFASVSTGGNKLTVEEEQKKLSLVTDTQFAAWGFEG